MRLAKGARDLSAGYKKSNSVPNLSWDNIENTLFSKYPTRNKENILRQRPKSHSINGLGDVDCSQWTNDDFKTNSRQSNNTELSQAAVLGTSDLSQAAVQGMSESNKISA